MLVFSDCSEHISGKGISFLVVLDLLSSNKTVVKILYPVFLKLQFFTFCCVASEQRLL